MSRAARAGTPGKPRALRATDAEWEAWSERAAEAELSVSEWLRQLANRATASRALRPRDRGRVRSDGAQHQ